MPETGTITTDKSGVDLVVEWKIPFFILLECDGANYYSPEFSLDGERWSLMILPNGWSNNGTFGHVNLYLCRSPTGSSTSLTVSLSLKTAKGEKYKEQNVTKDFQDIYPKDRHEFHRFIPRSELTIRKSELVPDGVLTMVCTMRNMASATSDSNAASAFAECRHCKETFNADSLFVCPYCLEIASLEMWLNEHECQQQRPEGATSTVECPYCKLTLKASSMPTHEKSCMDKPMKCPQCDEEVAKKLWLDHKCLTARTNAIGNLLHDFKRLMVCGEHSDMTISVKGEEFLLHRSILAVRNPFFGWRFNNESQEATSGTLSIDDCDPDQFRTLIHYIYTGTADNLCPENVCGLYEVAVAYQEPQMRAECLQLMMNTLSVDNFCDYIVLALKHNQEELLQKATGLFVRKTKEIIRHDKWKRFLEKHPQQANELYMKALDKDGEK